MGLLDSLKAFHYILEIIHIGPQTPQYKISPQDRPLY